MESGDDTVTITAADKAAVQRAWTHWPPPATHPAPATPRALAMKDDSLKPAGNTTPARAGAAPTTAAAAAPTPSAMRPTACRA